MNSINPFDDVYDAGEISKYFGIDSITRERAKLEVHYWDLISELLSKYGHYKSRPPSEAEVELALEIASEFEYNDVVMHLGRTHHEIKALEYALRQIFEERSIPAGELLHWGLTSQDIVDPVYTLAIRAVIQGALIPELEILLEAINIFRSRAGFDSQFPARTHGQLAVPTAMHKEMGVFSYRLGAALTHLSVSAQSLRVKFGGAVGSLTVHHFIDAQEDWARNFEIMFLEHYNIRMHEFTTQVNGNDDKARVFADLVAVNNICIGLCQDIWQYFSYDLIKMERDPGHVGSSTMAQKNNPIEFENVEGILQLANSELHFMIDKLTKSRMQRDLSDSVVQRFYGLMFAKCYKAYRTLIQALDKIEHQNMRGQMDIATNCQMYAEILQCCAKLQGADKFEEIKNEFMGKQVSVEELMEFVNKRFPEFSEQIQAQLVKDMGRVWPVIKHFAQPTKGGA